MGLLFNTLVALGLLVAPLTTLRMPGVANPRIFAGFIVTSVLGNCTLIALSLAYDPELASVQLSPQLVLAGAGVCLVLLAGSACVFLVCIEERFRWTFYAVYTYAQQTREYWSSTGRGAGVALREDEIILYITKRHPAYWAHLPEVAAKLAELVPKWQLNPPGDFFDNIKWCAMIAARGHNIPAIIPANSQDNVTPDIDQVVAFDDSDPHGVTAVVVVTHSSFFLDGELLPGRRGQVRRTGAGVIRQGVLLVAWLDEWQGPSEGAFGVSGPELRPPDGTSRHR